ncbi:MAG TPA: RHS repeat-associated core domain-containing protein [bacterium]|nr:RHS repeat-associated core domain-containing protein [bacterium]
MTPQGTSRIQQANTSGQTVTFTVTNQGLCRDSYNFDSTATGPISGVTLNPTSATLYPNQSTNVTATYNLGNPGTGQLTLTATSPFTSAQGWYTVTAVPPYQDSVTPKGGTLPTEPASWGTYPASFTIKNTGYYTDTYGVTCATTGPVTCTRVSATSVTVGGQGGSVIDTAYYTGTAQGSGTLTLTAASSHATDNGYYTVPIGPPPGAPVLDATPYNYAKQDYGLCDFQCFASVYAQGTVPYVSLDRPRNLTLVYNGDGAHPVPFVLVNASPDPNYGSTPSQYRLQVRVNGTRVTFVNGDTTLYFGYTSSAPVRIGGQFDASGYATGVYQMDILVSTYFPPNTILTNDVKTLLVVVNQAGSSIARGWSIGVPRLYQQSDGSVLIVEGYGSSAYFAFSSGNPQCPLSFTTPTGDFSQLVPTSACAIQGWTRLYPDSTKIVFDNAGHAAQLVDRFGNTTTITYDGSGRVYQLKDPLNAAITLGYGANGLASIQDPMGRVTGVTVDGSGRLTTITDPDNVATTLGYDASLRLSIIVNRRGDTTTFYNNSLSWKLDSVAAPRFTLDPRLYGSGATGRPTTRYRPWQAVGIPTTPTSPTSPATPARADTVRAAVTAPGGQISAFTVDHWGQPLVTTDLPGTNQARVTTVYRTDTRPDSIRHHEGGVDRFWYTGAYLTSHKPAGQSQRFMRIGAFGQVDSTWGSGIVTQRFYLGARGRVDSVLTAGQSTSRLTYDTFGRVLTTQLPTGGVTSYHYESGHGNLDSILAPGGRYAHVRFDAYGRDSVDQANALPWAHTVYDVLNRVTKTFDEGQGDTTRFAYDALNLTQVQDAKGWTNAFQYNALGLPTQRTDPAGAMEAFYYNVEGLRTTWINRRGDTVKTTYDMLDRPLTVSGGRVTSRSFAYDSAGLVSTAWNAYVRDSVFRSPAGWADSIVTRFATDGTNRFRTYYRPNAVQLVDSIGIAGTGTSVVFAARRYVWNQTTLNLDTLRLDGVAVNQASNPDFVVTRMNLPGSLTRTLNRTSLDAFYQSTYNNSTVNQALWRAWGYDSLNRVTETFFNAYPPDTRHFVYSYDQLGRLYDVADSILTNACTSSDPDYGGRWCSSTQSTFQSHEAWSYDTVGNIRSVSDFSGSGTPTYTVGSRLTSWPGYTFGNDANGNRNWRVQTAYPNDSTKYFWSADGLLDSVAVVAGTSIVRTIEYDYYPGGLLARKRVNGTPTSHFLWDRGQLVAELNSTFGRVAEYAYYPGTDNPAARMQGTTTVTSRYYYHLDAQGSVWGETDDNGAVRRQDLWEPWGSVASGDVTGDADRLGWKALPYEGDSTQLYYVRARWYDPGTKRFVTEDPIGPGGGVNPYTFAGSDAVNGFDPSGLLAPDPYWLVPVNVLGGGNPQGWWQLGDAFLQPLFPGSIYQLPGGIEGTSGGWTPGGDGAGPEPGGVPLAWPAPACEGAAREAAVSGVAYAAGWGLGAALGTLAEAGTLATEAAAFNAQATEFASADLNHLAAISFEVAERTEQEALITSVKAVGRVAGASGVGGRALGKFLTHQDTTPAWYNKLHWLPFFNLGLRIGEFINGCVLAPLGLY